MITWRRRRRRRRRKKSLAVLTMWHIANVGDDGNDSTPYFMEISASEK